MRFEFVTLLEREMSTNENIMVLLGDLGYGIFDVIREKFPR